MDVDGYDYIEETEKEESELYNMCVCMSVFILSAVELLENKNEKGKAERKGSGTEKDGARTMTAKVGDGRKREKSNSLS